MLVVLFSTRLASLSRVFPLIAKLDIPGKIRFVFVKKFSKNNQKRGGIFLIANTKINR